MFTHVTVANESKTEKPLLIIEKKTPNHVRFNASRQFKIAVSCIKINSMGAILLVFFSSLVNEGNFATYFMLLYIVCWWLIPTQQQQQKISFLKHLSTTPINSQRFRGSSCLRLLFQQPFSIVPCESYTTYHYQMMTMMMMTKLEWDFFRADQKPF